MTTSKKENTKISEGAGQKKVYFTKAEVKKAPQSMVSIEGNIGADILAQHRKKVIAEFNKSVSIDGFRKGNAPEQVILQKVGAASILREMAYAAIEEAYPHIVVENKINPISSPEISISKLSEETGVEFTAKVAVAPEISISGYTEIAKEIYGKKDGATETTTAEPTEKEQEEAIERILHGYVHHLQKESGGHENGKSHDDHTHDSKDAHDHGPLPELTDELVKGLGQFKDVADFKEKVKAGIIEEKRMRDTEKKRVQLVEKLLKVSSGDIPQVLIDHEMNFIEQQFRHDIQHMGVSPEDYLKHAKKNIEDMRKEWAADAEKRAKIKTILATIAQKESLFPSEETVATEVGAMMTHYKNADKGKMQAYAETVLTNENVFAFLEKGVKPESLKG